VVDVIKVLAIDQASIHSAYSVWNDSELIKYGTVTADKKIKTHLRIRQMSVGLMEIINEIEPDYVVFEDCQLQAGNAATFQVLLEQERNTRDFSHEMNFLADSKCIEKSVHSGEKSSNKET
jgi:hypothetical protein